MLGRGTPWAARAGLATGSLAMDDLIAASGVAYRTLANPYFMENMLRQAESIKNQGLFSWPIAGDRKRPAVATRLQRAVRRGLTPENRPSRSAQGQQRSRRHE